MSSLEKVQTEPAKAPDASHKFHLELSMTDSQIRNAELAMGAVGAAVLGLVALKTGKLTLLEESIPSIESAANGLRADLLRLAKVPPKQNYFQLSNGLELQLSRNARVYGRKADLISVSHHSMAKRIYSGMAAELLLDMICLIFMTKPEKVCACRFQAARCPACHFKTMT